MRLDQKAFTDIYERYWDKLLGIAYYHSQSKSVSEEIVQDVFLSLWRRHRQVDIQSIENYLATAVKFTVINHMLKERRRAEILGGKPVPSQHDIASHVEARFLEQYINGVIESLPEKCRIVFQYSRVRGLSNEAIANELGLSVKTVEAHINKAIRVIRTSLKDSYLPSSSVLAITTILEMIK